MEQVILVVPKCSQILCYTQISADYLLLHSPRHIKLKFDTEFNIFPHNQQFTISFPFPIFILLFFFYIFPGAWNWNVTEILNVSFYFISHINHEFELFLTSKVSLIHCVHCISVATAAVQSSWDFGLTIAIIS